MCVAASCFSDAEHSDLSSVELDPLWLSTLHSSCLEVDAEDAAAVGEDLFGHSVGAALPAEQEVDRHGPQGGRVAVRTLLHESALLGLELQRVGLGGVLHLLQLDQREASLHQQRTHRERVREWTTQTLITQTLPLFRNIFCPFVDACVCMCVSPPWSTPSSSSRRPFH